MDLLGARFPEAFRGYAAGTPRPAGGSDADAEAFGRYLAGVLAAGGPPPGGPLPTAALPEAAPPGSEGGRGGERGESLGGGDGFVGG